MSDAWIFPGQGSQVVGMGKDLYEQFPSARAIFDEADAILGFGLAQLCFEGPGEVLTATENAQPALLTASVALLAALGWSPQASETPELPDPRFVAGHSLGEYSALVAARALSFPTALRLVRRRGELMAEAREGTMAAIIGMNLEALNAVCAEAQAEGPVVVANENAPGQLVISGANAAVARAGELAKVAGASRVIPLKVSAAFHSPLMQNAANGLRPTIEAAAINSASLPVIANVGAQPIDAPAQIRDELVAQITAPVRWIASVEYMVAAGADRFIEIGPGAVLAGMIKRISPAAERRNIAQASDVIGKEFFYAHRSA
ncbi:MAG: Malonyl CoA-acyl carrier protein transacylase [uncultured Chloroflexia bacterium]|uniref:Malonyl CoA-acyl carrier protein transacylase n=1 Tax=uncultured Chloroflexia bacterium TaxID=1672391 RepID=A0A6J4MSJ5_9CHLR|nr:MAG: Malonyl CoA-acyl carrier protein transacylase [uncultured Chloroflexia bacterium]